MSHQTETSRLLRLRDVVARTGLSKTTIYRLEAEGRFPRRRQLSERLVAWPETDVTAWLSSRVEVVPAVRP